MQGQDEYDLLVIGAGSGGVRCARVAAALGARVAVIERGPIGGTCVNAGCVPKKLLCFAAERARAIRDAAGFGLHVGAPALHYAELAEGKDREVHRLREAYARTLASAGVHMVPGTAQLRDAHTVEVGDRPLRARYVVLATGGRPFVPAIPGAELGQTSDDVLSWRELPRRVLIVGAGVIGVELAGVLHAFGAQLTLVFRGARPLSDFDEALGMHLGQELVKQGIESRERTQPRRITRTPQGLEVTLDHGSPVVCDAVIFATGRVPNTEGLGLPEAGVQRDDQGAILTDAFGRSSVDTVFAIGDCLGGHALTPLAIAQGEAVAHTLFGTAPQPLAHRLVPRAVFSHPAVASVGLTETEARREGGEIRVYESSYKPLEHALSGRPERALVKLVVSAQSGRVLGCHMVASDAPEVLQGFAVAMACGATKADFDQTLGIHPTAAEEFVTLRSGRA